MEGDMLLLALISRCLISSVKSPSVIVMAGHYARAHYHMRKSQIQIFRSTRLNPAISKSASCIIHADQPKSLLTDISDQNRGPGLKKDPVGYRSVYSFLNK